MSITRTTIIAQDHWCAAELRICGGDVSLFIGGDHIVDIGGVPKSDMPDLLDRYAEIFAAAAEHLRREGLA